jgi:hypothetical protein
MLHDKQLWVKYLAAAVAADGGGVCVFDYLEPEAGE